MQIVVPSLGRCGSTVVAEALRDAFPELPYSFVRHPNGFPEAGVIKTHCWAPRKLNENSLYVYVYGDPVIAAISAHQQPLDFLRLHYMHMGGSLHLWRFWDVEDTLHLRENYMSWGAHYPAKNLLFLHYERVFNPAGQDELSQFVGRSVRIPERAPRSTVFDPANPQHVNAERTYADIIKV